MGVGGLNSSALKINVNKEYNLGGLKTIFEDDNAEVELQSRR